MMLRRILLALAVLAISVVTPVEAASPSASFEGSAEAGGADKRRCCENAVWLAQERSIALCEADGRHEQVRAGTMRGLCKVTRTAPDTRDWRCAATSRATCR
jgi:hypothetical protein